jgi:formylglycine-generating enzyme required for sulfatase activity
MNTREQGTSWQSGVGFLNFPDDSIITSWQRGTLENSRLFDWLLRSKQWKAAAAIASEDASSQRKDRLEKALRDHAAAAAGLKKWREARQLLSRLKHQTETPETATLVESIEHQLPASEGIDFENEEGVAMVWCDPGTFTMGSPEQEAGREADEPLIPVTIESGFWIGKYEITNAQYGEIMGTNAHKESDYAGSQLPASDISSVDAIEYCRRLTVRERIRGAIPSGWEYHLPTEEQWEYACRAGSQTAYCFGEDMDGLDEYAWHADNGPGHPQPVGQKKANAWGLHDMHGNVHEWCRNYVEGEFGIPYTGVIDNSHPDIRRVYRGGSFYNGPEACRSAVRGWWKPLAYWGIGGFRVALVPLTESPQSP